MCGTVRFDERRTHPASHTYFTQNQAANPCVSGCKNLTPATARPSVRTSSWCRPDSRPPRPFLLGPRCRFSVYRCCPGTSLDVPSRLHRNACIRMVLAYRGTLIAEADIAAAYGTAPLSIFSIFRGKDLSGFQQDVFPRQVRLENLTGLPRLLRGYPLRGTATGTGCRGRAEPWVPSPLVRKCQP